MTVSILEKVKVDDLKYRKERENYHICKFNIFFIVELTWSHDDSVNNFDIVYPL